MLELGVAAKIRVWMLAEMVMGEKVEAGVMARG